MLQRGRSATGFTVALTTFLTSYITRGLTNEKCARPPGQPLAIGQWPRTTACTCLLTGTGPHRRHNGGAEERQLLGAEITSTYARRTPIFDTTLLFVGS